MLGSSKLFHGCIANGETSKEFRKQLLLVPRGFAWIKVHAKMAIPIFVAMKLDILAFGAHPDDVELAAGGTLAKHCAMGYKVGIIDLTRGELGTRGTPELRIWKQKKLVKSLVFLFGKIYALKMASFRMTRHIN